MSFLFAVPAGDVLVQTPPIDSAVLGLQPPSPAKFDSFSTNIATPAITPVKKDPGGIGFLDEVGGSVDGLMSCTESLGFESSDERGVDLPPIVDAIDYSCSEKKTWKWKRSTLLLEEKMNRKSKKKFPPPLSSLSCDGKPTFLLRPVRSDGRLEIRELKIDRPDVLLASRQDGRLRLHLVRDEETVEAESEASEEEIQLELEELEIEEKFEQNNKNKKAAAAAAAAEEEDEEEEKEEERSEEWSIPARSNDGGDSYRRWCHEGVHSHHQLHVWRQHCVTTG